MRAAGKDREPVTLLQRAEFTLAALGDAGLSASEKNLAGIIALGFVNNRTGQAYASAETLGNAASCSRQCASRARQGLFRKGWLRLVRPGGGHGRSARYVLVLDRIPPHRHGGGSAAPGWQNAGGTANARTGFLPSRRGRNTMNGTNKGRAGAREAPWHGGRLEWLPASSPELLDWSRWLEDEGFGTVEEIDWLEKRDGGSLIAMPALRPEWEPADPQHRADRAWFERCRARVHAEPGAGVTPPLPENGGSE